MEWTRSGRYVGRITGGAFDQGDLPGFVGFSGDGSEGFAFRSDLEIVNKPNDIKEFTALCHRWVGERTFAWMSRCRRLAKDYERSLESSLAWAQLAACRFMMR